MDKGLHRIASLLLAVCFLTDPSLASAIADEGANRVPASACQKIAPRLLAAEAIAAPYLVFPRHAILRQGRYRQTRLLSRKRGLLRQFLPRPAPAARLRVTIDPRTPTRKAMPRWMRVALVWTMAAVLATHTLFISACGGSQTAPPPPTVGTPPYAIAAVPNSVKFSNVPIGTYATQTVQLINKGTNALTITNVNVTGLGFGVAGFTGAPIPAGQQSTIDVIFAPNATIQANGTLSVATRELTSPLLVSLSGTGEQATGATGPLGISPLAIDFGSSPDGTQQTQQVQLTNTGNADMTVSQVSVIVGQDVFTVSGFTPGTVPAGQSTAFTVAYTAVGGTRNGLILINAAVGSTAIDAAIPLAGTGNHWVSLTWDSSSSDVVGYNLYRADATSPNIYVKMNPSLIAAGSGNTIVDNMVISGHTYYYVATAVDSSGQESGYSNKATAIIPSP